MDDSFTYMLSGLLTRHFALGRIARFRQVNRGRQAATYEVLTAQQNEYLVYLFPPTFAPEHLSFAASAVNRLDESRFSVMPYLKTKAGEATIAGPQGTHLMVGMNPTGSPRSPATWTHQQLSELGLRLAWMHRALREEMPHVGEDEDLVDALEDSLELPADRLPRNQPSVTRGDVDPLLADLAAPANTGLSFVHGDLSTDALLVDDDQQLRYILDWGLLHAGIPAEDLVWIFTELCARDESRMRPVLEAYATLEPLSPETMRHAVARAIARRLVDARAGRAPIRPALDLLINRNEISGKIVRAMRG